MTRVGASQRKEVSGDWAPYQVRVTGLSVLRGEGFFSVSPTDVGAHEVEETASMQTAPLERLLSLFLERALSKGSLAT